MKTQISLLLVILIFSCFSLHAQKKSLPEVSALPEQKGLPDPLIMLDRTSVKTKEQWTRQRRPELKALFQNYMYGYLPDAPKIKSKVTKTYRDFFGGKATMREVEIDLGVATVPKINVMVITPNKAKKPSPAILGINFCGNHTVVNDPRVTMNPNWIPVSNCFGIENNRATAASRGQGIDKDWGVEAAIDRGYAVATFYSGDIVPDKPDFTQGVFPYFKSSEANKDSSWGAVAAWAWGFHRVLDFVVKDKAIDKNRIAAFGHSRLGKAAIFAAAMDERIAMVFPHQAGMGGTSPNRGTTGESVKAINDRFPHWFNGNFKNFNDDKSHLPFDQHCLVALMAPRPVLFSCAVDDTWSNPPGQFEMLQAADKVYKFLGVDGLNANVMPEPGNAVNSRLGYFYRNGKHSTTAEDWKAFLDFADQHFSGSKSH